MRLKQLQTLFRHTLYFGTFKAGFRSISTNKRLEINKFRNIIQLERYMLEKLPLRIINWERHVAHIAKAHAHLARFDEMWQSLPNQELVLAYIVLQEAIMSTRLEGSMTTLEEILEFEARQHLSERQDVQAINNYRKALQDAIKNRAHTPLTLNGLKEVHKILLKDIHSNHQKEQAAHTSAGHVPEDSLTQARLKPLSLIELLDYLSNFEQYVQCDDQEKLVQLAVIYAQFEQLHPFVEGNGHIARILVPLFLYQKQLLAQPIFTMSGCFAYQKEAYHAQLKNLAKHKNWDDWIAFFLEAIIAQAQAHTSLAKQIHHLYKETKKHMLEMTRSQATCQILHFIFTYPIFKGSSFIKITNMPKATASRLLNALVDGKILMPTRQKTGRAGQLYHFEALINILKTL